jgi:hypothetical protein
MNTPTVPHYESSDRFRYKVLRGPWVDPGALVKILNRFGDRGWEVVQVDSPNGTPMTVYMKMLLDDTTEEESLE